MTDNQQVAVGTPKAGTGPGARTMRFQALANRIVRAILRTPGLSRLAGRRLLTVYVVGRTTGRKYCVPVAYRDEDGVLLVGTSFGWVRNLRTGEPVDLRLKGARRAADVEIVADEPGVVAAYARMARGNHTFATFNAIGLDASGEPDPADLHRAWTEGARAVRFTPR